MFLIIPFLFIILLILAVLSSPFFFVKQGRFKIIPIVFWGLTIICFVYAALLIFPPAPPM